MIRLSRRSLVDLGLLILVNAMWGAQFTAYKLVSSDMGPVTVSAWIFLVAGIVLAPFVVRERRHGLRVQKSDAQDSDNDRSLLSKRNLAGFVAISVFGLVPASAFMAWGVARSTASNSALINLTIPIITALLAVAMLGERMTAARWSSLFVSLAGVLILSDFDWRHMALTSNRFLLGNLLVLLSCACSSFYNVCSKELLRRFSPVEVLTFGYFLAVLVTIPLLCWIEPFSPSVAPPLFVCNLDRIASARGLRLGPGHGSVDVFAETAGRKPGICLGLSAPISGGPDLSDISGREDHRHDGSGAADPGRDDTSSFRWIVERLTRANRRFGGGVRRCCRCPILTARSALPSG